MLTENQEKYLQKILENKMVKISPFDPGVIDIANKITQQIKLAGIDLRVRFMGASALGIAGQGDIDLYVLCPEAHFDKFLPKLEKLFGSKVPGISIHKWEFNKGGHDVELYLTDPSSPSMQEQIKVYEILKSKPVLLKEYAEIKKSADGLSFREYMRRKYEFFNKLIS